MAAAPKFIRRRKLQLATTRSERARLHLRFWLQDVDAWLNLPRSIALVLFAIGMVGLVARWLLREVFASDFIDLDESIWLELSPGMAFLSISVLLIGWASETVSRRQQRASELVNLTALDADLAVETLARLRVKGWLSDGTLSDARLDHLQLPDTDFMTPIIEETDEGRTEVYLQAAELHKSRLRRADLRNSRLDGANLAGADLRDSNLRGASLKGADLRGTDLRGADLTDATLDGALVHDPDPTWSTDTTMPDGRAWSGQPPEAATSGQ
jgi:hypothetical protein